MTSAWLKQTSDKPLYPDLLWSRPENRAHAGKLLVIGGNLHGFSAAGTAYREATAAGIGTSRVLIPDALKKTIGTLIPAAEFCPSTPSGSFALRALDTWLEHAAWADGVIIAGDIGRNSETAILLEHFLGKYTGQVTLTKDAIEYIIVNPAALDREETTLVLSFSQLQKLAQASGFKRAFTFDMTIVNFVEALREFTTLHPISVITRHYDKLFVASGGQISETTTSNNPDLWRLQTAAHASVWWLQNPGQKFKALTTAAVQE